MKRRSIDASTIATNHATQTPEGALTGEIEAPLNTEGGPLLQRFAVAETVFKRLKLDGSLSDVPGNIRLLPVGEFCKDIVRHTRIDDGAPHLFGVVDMDASELVLSAREYDERIQRIETFAYKKDTIADSIASALSDHEKTHDTVGLLAFGAIIRQRSFQQLPPGVYIVPGFVFASADGERKALEIDVIATASNHMATRYYLIPLSRSPLDTRNIILLRK